MEPPGLHDFESGQPLFFDNFDHNADPNRRGNNQVAYTSQHLR